MRAQVWKPLSNSGERFSHITTPTSPARISSSLREKSSCHKHWVFFLSQMLPNDSPVEQRWVLVEAREDGLLTQEEETGHRGNAR